jgi:hypothetical protein
MEDSGMESELIDLFALHDISGAILLDLQFSDLKELGIASFGKRHQIWNHIGTLRDTPNHISPVPTPFEENLAREAAQDCVGMTPVTPGGGQRRRRRMRANDPITPGESVSIVAIEQLLPKPHRCAKGERCHKWRKQQKLLKQLRDEHGLPISPEDAGGQIFMAGNPGNVTGAHNLVTNVHNLEADYRPTSEAEPSVVGPSVVASSDLLGPGDFPPASLDEDRLRMVGERDAQDNVKQFLAFQHIEPPQAAFTEEVDTFEHHPQLKPPQHQPAPLASLASLPRLQIPMSSVAPPQINLGAPEIGVIPISAVDDMFSPCRTALDTPIGGLYRFGTPASEMDVPVTHMDLGPISRDTSQSVPPNMQFRDPVQRSGSRAADWRRTSMALPSLAEDKVFEAAQSHTRDRANSGSSRTSSTAQSQGSQPGVESSAASSKQKRLTASSKTSVSASSSQALVMDPRYGDVNHSGWMKKRKTKLLRHEWNEHHFRLSNARAQLTMHKNDMPASSPLEALNIDEYAVACSSLASSSKLAARFKSLKLQSGLPGTPHPTLMGKDSAHHGRDAAFAFQLVPTKPGREEAAGKLRKAMEGKKTHYFAVKARDERIDWMRELMLAKAQREKESKGYDVQVDRGD